MNNILSWIVFIPAIGAVLCLLAPKRQARTIALLATLATLLLSLTLFSTFLGGRDAAGAQCAVGSSCGKLHHVGRATWIELPGKLKIEYFLGIDGLAFPLFILTTLVSFLACWASWGFDHWTINK